MRLCLLFMSLFISVLGLAESPPDQGGAAASMPVKAGIVGYRGVDIEGNMLRLGMDRAPKPVVVVFLDHQCTIANQLTVTLNKLAKQSQSLGIDFIGVYSDPTLSLKTLLNHKKDYQFIFPLVLDAIGDLGLRLKPAVIPEVFVIDKDDRVFYRGMVDNRFADLGRKRRVITEHYLEDAIKAVAEGKSLEVSQTQPIGCLFEAWKAPPEEVNFNRHVEPLLRANCGSCHADGGIGPFPLQSYADSKRRSGMVAYVTESGLMPPWRAKAQAHQFRDERLLSQRQKDILKLWHESQAVEGPEEEKIAPSPEPTSNWPLGKPDLELKMVEPFPIPASGEDIYRYFVIPMNLLEEKDVIAIDFQPGDRRVVHHANIFVDYQGRARNEDAKDDLPGFSVFGTGSFMDYDGANALGGWAPGMEPYQIPEGLSAPIGSGGDLVIEIHYHLIGRETEDQSTVALYFSDEPVEKYIYGLFLGTQDMDIPANDDAYCRHFYMHVPEEMTLVDIAPHMHYLGKGARLVATFPDQTKVTLIDIPEWDLNWQNIYVYSEPMVIPAGSRIDAWYTYDNSPANPANPHYPPERVKWGWGTDDEMSEVYLTIIPKNDRSAERLLRASRLSWYRSAECP